MEYIQLHVTGKPIPLNERVPGKTFPPLLEQVIDRALAKQPEERFASAADFATAMQHVLQGAVQLPGHLLKSNPSEVPTTQFPLAEAAAALQAAGNAPQARGQAGGGPAGAPRSPNGPGMSPLAPPNRGPGLTRPSLRGPKTNVGLLVGVALAFLLLGVGLAVVLMKLVVK